MKRRLYAAAAVAALAGAAAAPAFAQQATWQGLYLGAHAGWSTLDQKSDTVRFDTNLDGAYGDTVRTAAGANAFSPGFCGGAAATSLPGAGCLEGKDGFEYGARLGYDWQFGAFVLGVVGEGNKTRVTENVSAFSTTPAYYAFSRRLDSVIALRARAGFAFDRDLVYVTGGAARGEIEHAFATSNTANSFRRTESDDTNGYQLGAGVERKLTANVSMGLEYIYTDLDDDGYVVRAMGPAPATNPFLLVNPAGTDMRPSEDSFKTHSLRLTASYRF